jgi:dCTP deaminase
VLSDVEIRELVQQGAIVIDPYPSDADFQPASLDVHLGSKFRVFHPGDKRSLNTRAVPADCMMEINGTVFVLQPQQFALGIIAESVTLPNNIAARIEGKSSLGRLGVGVHITAGFVDPGWSGHLTIELYNFSPHHYVLEAGQKIAQLAFERLSIPSARPYGHPELGSRYQNSVEPLASKGVG